MKTPLKEQKEFIKFCGLDSNRREIIISILEKESIPYSIITLEKSVHIILFPQNLVTGAPGTVLLAHYDRVKNTPGANDNSASVFYLLYHAKRLLNKKHSTIIIFTDLEEIGGEDSVTAQGSYLLGKYLKSKKITNLSFYVFDMCGIGTTILLGTAGERLIKEHYKEKYLTSKIKMSIETVKNRAEEGLLSVNCGEFFYLTPLFSDDLGLILNEYPAVLISLLPYREVIEYKNNPWELPRSWSNNHSLDDSIETLDSNSWTVISPLLQRLSNITPIESPINNLKGSNSFTFKCYTKDSKSGKPNPIKVPVKLEIINSEDGSFNLISRQESAIIGTIKLLKIDDGYTMDSGDFNKELILKLDSVNLLKCLRSVLIKWLKLNDNNILGINLIKSNWVGCDDIYRLLKMELTDRSHKIDKSNYTIWMRNNGS